MMNKQKTVDFWLWAAIAVTAVAIGYLWEHSANAEGAACWLVLSGAGIFSLIFYARRHLDENRPSPQASLYPRLGAANWLTLTRGIALMLLLGFLCPHVGAGWAPALLYSFVALSDWWDGFIARSTGSASLFGKNLDLHLDGLGVLIASMLAVTLGRLPWWYITVGLARYILLGWEWLLRLSGRAPKPLPPDPNRRAAAGLMMAFLAASLYPIFSPKGLEIIGLWFFLPFMGGFVRDGLSVAGVKTSLPLKIFKNKAWKHRVLLLSRLASAATLAATFWEPATTAAKIAEITAVMLAVGALPRLNALAGLTTLLLGWSQGMPITHLGIAASAFLTLVAFYGAGRPCLWCPDERLFLTSASISRKGKNANPSS